MKEGDIVITPTGRLAKIKKINGDRADLQYMEADEVVLKLSLLRPAKA